MVNATGAKVKLMVTFTKNALEESLSSIDKSADRIRNWMNSCIGSCSVTDDNLNLSFSLSLSDLLQDKKEKEVAKTGKGAAEKMEESKSVDNKEIENELFNKYNAMSFKDIREECARLGITCYGLHQEYVRKLVTYEMEKRGLSSRPVAISPRILNPSSSARSTPPQRPMRPPVIIPPKINPPSLSARIPSPTISPAISPTISPTLSPKAFRRNPQPFFPASSPSLTKPNTISSPIHTAASPNKPVKAPMANTAPVIHNKETKSPQDQILRTKIPAWARSAGLKTEMRNQYYMERYCDLTPEAIFSLPEEVDLRIVMGSHLRRNAPRGSSANWTEVVKEYKAGFHRDIELSDDGIVAYETDSSSSTDDSLLSSS